MKRREFIAVLGVAAATWPLATRGQQIHGMRRVAILSAFAEPEPEVQIWFAAFVQQLRDLGWIEGANIQIDTHWASADVGRLNRAAMELIDRKSDVILANGPLTVAALRPMTSKIPIVFNGCCRSSRDWPSCQPRPTRRQHHGIHAGRIRDEQQAAGGA